MVFHAEKKKTVVSDKLGIFFKNKTKTVNLGVMKPQIKIRPLFSKLLETKLYI